MPSIALVIRQCPRWAAGGRGPVAERRVKRRMQTSTRCLEAAPLTWHRGRDMLRSVWAMQAGGIAERCSDIHCQRPAIVANTAAASQRQRGEARQIVHPTLLVAERTPPAFEGYDLMADEPAREGRVGRGRSRHNPAHPVVLGFVEGCSPEGGAIHRVIWRESAGRPPIFMRKLNSTSAGGPAPVRPPYTRHRWPQHRTLRRDRRASIVCSTT